MSSGPSTLRSSKLKSTTLDEPTRSIPTLTISTSGVWPKSTSSRDRGTKPPFPFSPERPNSTQSSLRHTLWLGGALFSENHMDGRKTMQWKPNTPDSTRKQRLTLREMMQSFWLGRDTLWPIWLGTWTGESCSSIALSLNPNLAAAWYVSGWLRIWLGDPKLALEHLARVVRLSPRDAMMPGIQGAIAFALFFAGRVDEAAAQAEEILRERPRFHQL